MPILKIDLNIGSSNYSSNEETIQKIGSSTQKTSSLHDRVNNNQYTIIQKFKQQAQELKQIKKTISTLSHSRINNMKRLKLETFHEQQSLNLYRFSQPQLRDNIFKLNKNRKVTVNLKFEKNEKQEEKCQKDFRSNLVTNLQTKVVQSAQNSAINQQKIKKQLNSDPTKEEPKIQKSVKTEDSPQKFINSEQKNSLPLESLKKKEIRSFSASQLKRVSNLAMIYKNQKLLDLPNSQVSLVTNNQTIQMDLKTRYEERLKESRAKIMSSKVKLIQSQTNFKLEKKIKQNLELIEKQKNLHELIHKRMQQERQKAQIMKRKNQEKRLIRESHKMKVKIQRIYKREVEQKEREFHRSKSQESLLNVTYNRLVKQMQDIKKQQLLAYKLEFLKNLESVEFRPVTKIHNPESDLMQNLYEEE